MVGGRCIRMLVPHEVFGGLEGGGGANRSRGREAQNARQVLQILAAHQGEATRRGVLRGGHEAGDQVESAEVAGAVVDQ
eukprot:7686775-Pyramimonas_sp.AAC.1